MTKTKFEEELFIISCKIYLFVLLKIVIISIISIFNSIKLVNFSKIVELDNEINNNLLYENDENFQNSRHQIDIFSIYYPEYAFLKIFSKEYNNSTDFFLNINNKNKLRKSQLQELKNIITENVKSAQNHRIKGFGIISHLFERNIFLEEIFDTFIENGRNDFFFFIILKNYSNNNRTNNLIKQSDLSLNIIIKTLDYLKKYIKSKYYFNIKKKPLLGIWQPFNINFLSSIRTIANEIGIGELYIIEIKEGNQISNLRISFDGFTELKEFPSKSLYIDDSLKNIYYFNYYYDFIKNKKMSELEFYNLNILEDSSPYKFYLLSNFIINLARKKQINSFILVNSWNNFEENYVLEYNNKHGYSYLNSLSKAILNTKYSSEKYYLNNNIKIAIQAHIFYEYLIEEIINKINNMPIKFDLYVSTISKELKYKIIKYINNSHSKIKNLEINIYENKGRDILPFLIQIQQRIKNYKYICHVHTKQSSANPYIGLLWRNYLYNNLLGNANIIREILSTFENTKKIGFIFPETYYLIYNETKKLKKKTKKYSNFIIRKLFNKYKIGELKNFPAGNMFWSKTKAIFQIFFYDFSKYFPDEDNQTNDTIMHGIERIWLYLVKLNGYYYKTIFKIF